MQNNKKVFAFMVLVYNHEKYVIEHLESIRYLVEEYGVDYSVDLYISDDCSRDRSKILIESWLSENEFYFRNVKLFFNTENFGTCKSVYNMLSNVSSDIDVCKITAADDVYSFENIFELCNREVDYSFISGVPLSFTDSNLYFNDRDVSGILASQVIYNNKALIDRFKFLSVTNAPNLIYNKEFLLSKKTLDFLLRFDVVEDWPIQISIAEQAVKLPFQLDLKVYVYYRRTQASAYIVVNKRFFKDKVRIFNYLIDCSKNSFDKFLISNRRFLFSFGNKFFNIFFNISFYRFLLCFFIKYPAYIGIKRKLVVDQRAHNSHLLKIRESANVFLSRLK